MLTKHTYFLFVPVIVIATLIAVTPVEAGPLSPLDVPARRFQHAIHVTVARMEAARKAHARRERQQLYASLPGGVSMATLDSIASCESGGDPTAVSADGAYRGKYQFDFGTWEAVGGSGDPAVASEAEQDYRAALLYSESGSSPWPVCG